MTFIIHPAPKSGMDQTGIEARQGNGAGAGARAGVVLCVQPLSNKVQY